MMSRPMLEDKMLSKIIRATILSARVHCSHTYPVSIFLIAPIESGKTSLALQNAGKNPLIVTDVSGIGLLEALHRNTLVTHVVINDVAAVGGHKSTVSKLTISILNGLAEEGVFKIALPRMEHLDLKGRKVGVIACCTPDLIKDNRSWWKRSGFASRVLPVRYEHSVNLQFKILESIASNAAMPKTDELRVPTGLVRVTIGKEESHEILNISQMIAKQYKEKGYRRQKQLRSLACGAALLRGWKDVKVTDKEIAFLVEALPFFTNQGQEI